MQNVALVASTTSTVEDLLSDAGMQLAVQRQVEQWLRLLQRVRDHGNVALACAAEGLPRPTYYRVWRQFRAGAIPGLSKAARRSIERSAGFREQVDRVVLALSRANPTWGRHRVSKYLRSQGKDISARQVWCVWKRHQMLDRSSLIEASEAASAPAQAPAPAVAAPAPRSIPAPLLPAAHCAMPPVVSAEALRSVLHPSQPVLALVQASAL